MQLELLKELIVYGNITISTTDRENSKIYCRTIIQLDADFITKIRRDILQEPEKFTKIWAEHCEKIKNLGYTIQKIKNILKVSTYSIPLFLIPAVTGIETQHTNVFIISGSITGVAFLFKLILVLIIPRHWRKTKTLNQNKITSD